MIAQLGQLVIDRGAYALVRHPSYSAGIAMFAGIGLALGNWASFLVAVAVSLVVYDYRMRVEERALPGRAGPRPPTPQLKRLRGCADRLPALDSEVFGSDRLANANLR